MLIRNIEILHEITDIENGNIDVCVHSEDGYTYTVTVATAKNIEHLMDKDKMNYFEPGLPFIIVKKLTEEIISEAIQAYADDAYWLKLYNFAGEIDISVFDELQAKHVKESIEFNLLCGLDDLENEINKFDNLDNAQKSNLAAKIEKLAQLLDSQ